MGLRKHLNSPRYPPNYLHWLKARLSHSEVYDVPKPYHVAGTICSHFLEYLFGRQASLVGRTLLRSAHVGEIHHSSPLQTLENKEVLEHLLDHRAVVRVSGLKLRLITIIMISNPFNHNITTS